MKDNNLILRYKPEIIRINDKNFISIYEYKKDLNILFDVIFNNDGKEIFIGRFIKEFNNIRAKYHNGKILVYETSFIKKIKENHITKVYALYDIVDDTFYSVTEEEALVLFDLNLCTKHLKNKDNSLIRTDLEKMKRLIK